MFRIGKFTLPCVIMFLVGSFLRIDIYFMGRLSLGEILLILLFPWAIKDVSLIFQIKYFRKFMLFLVIWLLSAILSDVLNQSDLTLLIRGAARPLICIIVLISGFYLVNWDRRAIIYFFFGLCLSGVLNYFNPTDFRVDTANIAGNISDMSYGTLAFLLTPLIYGIASVGGFFLYRITPLFAGLFQLFIGGFVAALLSRTTAGMIILSGLVILITSYAPWLRSFFFERFQMKKNAVLRLLAAMTVIIFMGYYTYAFAASSGFIGERQQLKYISQSETVLGNTPWGLLAHGRHYTVAAILRIIDNPIFGAGSWPYAGDTLVRTFELLGVMDYGAINVDPFQREIGHSIVFGIWAQNGPLVLPAFIMVLYTTLRLTLHLAFARSPLKALMLAYLFTFLFTMFFNNFNSLARVQMMFYPLLYYYYIQFGLLDTGLPDRRLRAGQMRWS